MAHICRSRLALGEEFVVDDVRPGQLRPPIGRLRDVARTIAIAIAVARAARDEELYDPYEVDALGGMIDVESGSPPTCPMLKGDTR